MHGINSSFMTLLVYRFDIIFFSIHLEYIFTNNKMLINDLCQSKLQKSFISGVKRMTQLLRWYTVSDRSHYGIDIHLDYFSLVRANHVTRIK